MNGTEMTVNEKEGLSGTVIPTCHRERSTGIKKWIAGGISCLGVLVVLAHFEFSSLMGWTSQPQLQGELQTQATCIFTAVCSSTDIFDLLNTHAMTKVSKDLSATTHLARPIIPRNSPRYPLANDNRVVTRKDQDDTTQSLITDSDGTWIIETSTQEYTDADGNTWIPATQEQPHSETTMTTTSVISLTDEIIISWKIKTETKILDHFVTVTITGKDTGKAPSQVPNNSISTHTSQPFSPNSSPTITSDTYTLTGTPQPSSSKSRPTTNTTDNPQQSPEPLSTPSANPATCPWTICTLTPTKMVTDLCQMVDPCWSHNDKPAPIGNGNKCACLCESGYCQSKLLKGCAERNCCHECGCFAGNQMSLQQGDGC